MAGQRAMRNQPLNFSPGFFSNSASRDAPQRWLKGSWVRFHKGFPQKIGGFVAQTLTGFNSGTYLGTARALHDWSSLDANRWLAIGTHCKLQLVNSGGLYDITPTRKSTVVNNPFTTQSGLSTVTVSDPSHGAEPGDSVFVTAASAVGGLTLGGNYIIQSAPSPDTYTITASSNASSSVTGGGSTSFAYDINCGLSSNGFLYGWGSGTWSQETWGGPRSSGGIPAKLRTWSLQNWGEDLIASQSDGELYWWDRTTGPASRAALIPEAPTSIQRCVVASAQRQIILFGCTGLDGTPDLMRIRWCSQENFNDWIATETNTAGGDRVSNGSRIITAVKTRTAIVFWTDTFLYELNYVGAPFQWVIRDIGETRIAGPNAAIEGNGVVCWFGIDNFGRYDGVIGEMSCDIHSRIFGKASPYRLDVTQAEKITGSYHHGFREYRWQYPSASGGGEIDRYVTYNAEDNCWYDGALTRTAYHGPSDFFQSYRNYPYAVNSGKIYTHETGTDSVDGSTTVIPWELTSNYVNVGGDDQMLLVNSLVPVFDDDEGSGISGSFSLTINKKRASRSVPEVRGPKTIDSTTDTVDIRCRASQFQLSFTNGTGIGQDFRFGIWQIFAGVVGQR